ncbi:uncharacterized protein LOC117115517 [Anneissia japonica]|uniref:uncharacterized protein LOC117115517 n=1 Tax=Anneissia japonica TaxID=1529436 RepID=UPI001425A3CB|nr:uncharacterized protein LOC117115517 [Anneissia japonica]
MNSNFKIWGVFLMLMIVEQKTTLSDNTKVSSNSTTKLPSNSTANENNDSGDSIIILVVFATTSIFSLTLFVVFFMVCCLKNCNNKRQLNIQGLNSSTLKTRAFKMYHNELIPKKNNSKDDNTADHVYEDPKLMKLEEEYMYADQNVLELMKNYEKTVLQESTSVGTKEKLSLGKPLSKEKTSIQKENEYYVNGMLSLKRTTKNKDKQNKAKKK